MKVKTGFYFHSPSGAVGAVNRRILEEWQRKPRLTMSEPGCRSGISSPAVTQRVYQLEETGDIHGYRLNFHPAALGLPIAVSIRICPTPGQPPRIAELAQRISEAVEYHRIRYSRLDGEETVE